MEAPAIPRPLDTTVARPPCPQGHAGRVWLDGFYARGSLYERPRFLCRPDAGKDHKFVEPLARRHPRAGHPMGTRCLECDHVPDRIEGPQTPWRFTFSIREAAAALNYVAHGASMREGAFQARKRAARARLNRYGQASTSRHGQLSADLVSLFAPAITTTLLPTSWPDAVVLDALPLQLRTVLPSGQPSKGNKIGLIVLGAYGYDAGQGQGQLWKLGVSGGLDQVEWETFLRSMPGSPTWVVSDANPALKLAIKAVWPQATFYACEAHLRMLALERLAEDGHYIGSKLYALANSAFANARGWAKFRAELASSQAPRTLAWAIKKDALMAHQFAIYQPGRPRSTGGIESALTRVKQMIGTRHYNFRNRTRVQLLLDLMTVRFRDDAQEARFAEIIRQSPRVSARTKRDRRALDDQAGASSLRAMTAAVEARLGAIRATRAAAFRTYLARRNARRAAQAANAGGTTP